EIIKRPYDGLLISKAIVEGVPGRTNKTRYSDGQKYRLFREGAHRFFRLNRDYEVMGDSGAFSYAEESAPPYSIDELIDFYVKADVNQGISLDHIVLGYRDERSRDKGSLP
ncbi:tRNA-guanine transglycosylase, partial [Vibrio parahaemolyticus]